MLRFRVFRKRSPGLGLLTQVIIQYVCTSDFPLVLVGRGTRLQAILICLVDLDSRVNCIVKHELRRNDPRSRFPKKMSSRPPVRPVFLPQANKSLTTRRATQVLASRARKSQRGHSSSCIGEKCITPINTDFDESPAQMANRVCRELGGKRNIVVINDEAHHCYWRKPDGEAGTLKCEVRIEAEKRN